MNALEVDWVNLKELHGADLKRATFKVIQDASFAIQSSEEDDPRILELVPRLVDLVQERRDDLKNFEELVGSLARSTGLWNYIDLEHADTTDAFVAEAVTSPELGGVTFHREQVRALNTLLSGKNLILSAPTSFGKSLLVDALLASDRYRRVAVVLPTIALLDEFRRRFKSRFKDKFQIVMHQSESSWDGPTIFLGTQERLIYRDDLDELDLTVVDEFYKLDPARQDDRSVTLNAAVYKLLKKSKQFFFLGPNIDSVSMSADTRWSFEFLRTRFSTVAVDTLDLRGIKDKKQRLIDEIGNEENWPALVFISAPDKANTLAIDLAECMAVSDHSQEFASWLKSNIGENNFLSQVVEYGFGVHHGRIPRAIAAKMVRMFDRNELPILLCTSTLIEGVNTAAKTVMIFDKKINRTNYDFFTFSNIRGRAGRLGQHHVGRVMLFNDVPEPAELDVSPTLFASDSEFPDEYIVHIDEPDRSQRSAGRFAYFKEYLSLEGEELRLCAAVGFDVASAIKSDVIESLRQSSALVWSGWPEYKQVLELCRIVCQNAGTTSFGVFSYKQLTFLVNKLRQSKTIRRFLLELDRSYKGKPEGQDNIFKFLRACEYGLPQQFAVVELFVKQVVGDVDYSFLVGGIGSWFRSEVLKDLDEEGVPIQISERFYREGDTKDMLRDKLRVLCHDQGSRRLTDFEKSWVLEAL